MDKRPTRWELNRIIRELRADSEHLERQVLELAQELAKRDKIIAELKGRHGFGFHFVLLVLRRSARGSAARRCTSGVGQNRYIRQPETLSDQTDRRFESFDA